MAAAVRGTPGRGAPSAPSDAAAMPLRMAIEDCKQALLRLRTSLDGDYDEAIVQAAEDALRLMVAQNKQTPQSDARQNLQGGVFEQQMLWQELRSRVAAAAKRLAEQQREEREAAAREEAAAPAAANPYDVGRASTARFAQRSASVASRALTLARAAEPALPTLHHEPFFARVNHVAVLTSADAALSGLGQPKPAASTGAGKVEGTGKAADTGTLVLRVLTVGEQTVVSFASQAGPAAVLCGMEPPLPASFCPGVAVRVSQPAAGPALVAMHSPQGVAVALLPPLEVIQRAIDAAVAAQTGADGDVPGAAEGALPALPCTLVAPAVLSVAGPVDVKWHPLSPRHLCVLCRDGLRVYTVEEGGSSRVAASSSGQGQGQGLASSGYGGYGGYGQGYGQGLAHTGSGSAMSFATGGMDRTHSFGQDCTAHGGSSNGAGVRVEQADEIRLPSAAMAPIPPSSTTGNGAIDVSSVGAGAGGSSSVEPVALSFGAARGWELLSLYILGTDGGVRTLCPYLPPGALVPSADWKALLEDAQAAVAMESDLSLSSMGVGAAASTALVVAGGGMGGQGGRGISPAAAEAARLAAAWLQTCFVEAKFTSSSSSSTAGAATATGAAGVSSVDKQFLRYSPPSGALRLPAIQVAAPCSPALAPAVEGSPACDIATVPAQAVSALPSVLVLFADGSLVSLLGTQPVRPMLASSGLGSGGAGVGAGAGYGQSSFAGSGMGFGMSSLRASLAGSYARSQVAPGLTSSALALSSVGTAGGYGGGNGGAGSSASGAVVVRAEGFGWTVINATLLSAVEHAVDLAQAHADQGGATFAGGAPGDGPATVVQQLFTGGAGVGRQGYGQGQGQQGFGESYASERSPSPLRRSGRSGSQMRSGSQARSVMGGASSPTSVRTGGRYGHSVSQARDMEGAGYGGYGQASSASASIAAAVAPAARDVVHVPRLSPHWDAAAAAGAALGAVGPSRAALHPADCCVLVTDRHVAVDVGLAWLMHGQRLVEALMAVQVPSAAAAKTGELQDGAGEDEDARASTADARLASAAAAVKAAGVRLFPVLDLSGRTGDGSPMDRRYLPQDDILGLALFTKQTSSTSGAGAGSGKPSARSGAAGGASVGHVLAWTYDTSKPPRAVPAPPAANGQGAGGFLSVASPRADASAAGSTAGLHNVRGRCLDLPLAASAAMVTQAARAAGEEVGVAVAGGNGATAVSGAGTAGTATGPAYFGRGATSDAAAKLATTGLDAPATAALQAFARTRPLSDMVAGLSGASSATAYSAVVAALTAPGPNGVAKALPALLDLPPSAMDAFASDSDTISAELRALRTVREAVEEQAKGLGPVAKALQTVADKAKADTEAVAAKAAALLQKVRAAKARAANLQARAHAIGFALQLRAPGITREEVQAHAELSRILAQASQAKVTAAATADTAKRVVAAQEIQAQLAGGGGAGGGGADSAAGPAADEYWLQAGASPDMAEGVLAQVEAARNARAEAVAEVKQLRSYLEASVAAAHVESSKFAVSAVLSA